MCLNVIVQRLEIYEEMKAGRYEIEMLDYIAFKVKSANMLKKSLKTM